MYHEKEIEQSMISRLWSCCLWAAILVASSNGTVEAWTTQGASRRISRSSTSLLFRCQVGGPRMATSWCKLDFAKISSPSSDEHDNNKNGAACRQLMTTLLDWFQGDFDNYRQVVEDRRQNRLPREGGGHEHIHCTLVPVTRDSRLAAFYFDGAPTAIFRFRYYRLVPANAIAAEENVISSAAAAVDTILYTLAPDLEGKLRKCSDDPLQWPSIFRNHILEKRPSSSDSDVSTLDLSMSAIDSDCVRLLPKCEVRWSWELDPVQHEYAAQEQQQQPGIHAVMVHGEAVVDSQMVPGQTILIKDQLSLWSDQLWIHDRGFDPDTGAFIYGNQRNVPYVLQRVTDIRLADVQHDGGREEEDHQPCRTIVDNVLAWTLGSEFRTPLEYEDRMDAMGGPSRPPRPPTSAPSS